MAEEGTVDVKVRSVHRHGSCLTITAPQEHGKKAAQILEFTGVEKVVSTCIRKTVIESLLFAGQRT